MGRFVHLLGIEGTAESKSDTLTDLHVVGERSDTAVVELALKHGYQRMEPKALMNGTYLSE